MSTPSTSTYHDAVVGRRKSISSVFAICAPGQTPNLSISGFDSPVEPKPVNTTHYYYDDAYLPNETTLASTLTAGVLTVVFSAAVFKPRQRVRIGNELIYLVSTSDNLTFVCTRSVGHGADATHASGTQCVLAGTVGSEGEAAGDADAWRKEREVTTYLQDFYRVADVSDTTEALGSVIAASQFNKRVVDLQRDMRKEIDQSFLMGKAAAAGSGSEGMFDGLFERIVGTNTTAKGSVNITPTDMMTIAEAIGNYDDPAVDREAVFTLHQHQANVASEWHMAHIVANMESPYASQYGIRVMRIRAGSMMISLIPHNPIGPVGIVWQPRMITWRHLVNPYFEKLPRDGKRIRGQMDCKVLPELRCPESGYVLTELPTS